MVKYILFGCTYILNSVCFFPCCVCEKREGGYREIVGVILIVTASDQNKEPQFPKKVKTEERMLGWES